MDLFTVTTTIRAQEFHGCRDVTMRWFVVDRPTPVVPYSEVVADYAALDDDYKLYVVHDAVDELFTDSEARALVEYMAREHPGDLHEITPARLPLEGNIMGRGAIPVGGPQDFYMLSREDEWTLPFQVYGYYDLERHEAAAGGEEERASALRSGMFFAGPEGIIRASDLSEAEYQARLAQRECQGRA